MLLKLLVLSPTLTSRGRCCGHKGAIRLACTRRDAAFDHSSADSPKQSEFFFFFSSTVLAVTANLT